MEDGDWRSVLWGAGCVLGTGDILLTDLDGQFVQNHPAVHFIFAHFPHFC